MSFRSTIDASPRKCYSRSISTVSILLTDPCSLGLMILGSVHYCSPRSRGPISICSKIPVCLAAFQLSQIDLRSRWSGSVLYRRTNKAGLPAPALCSSSSLSFQYVVYASWEVWLPHEISQFLGLKFDGLLGHGCIRTLSSYHSPFMICAEPRCVQRFCIYFRDVFRVLIKVNWMFSILLPIQGGLRILRLASNNEVCLVLW